MDISVCSQNIERGEFLMVEDEVFIITKEDTGLMKKKALELLDQLPNDPKSALLIVAFLEKHLEDTLGVRVKGIQVKSEPGGRS